jgi:Uma2 family endonuclease
MEAAAMSLLAGPHRGWTIDDLQQLPDFDDAGNQVDWRCLEILDGALIVSPTPDTWHGLALARLRRQLAACLPESYEMIEVLGVALGTSYLVPDLMIVHTDALQARASLLQPVHVLLAVEVVSVGSRTLDRVAKPAQYAAAGIAGYWRVETDPDVSLTAYGLAPGAEGYTELGTWGRGAVAEIDRPFTAAIEIDALLPAR